MDKHVSFLFQVPDSVICCPECGGEGVVDSGGQSPWGAWINIPCPLCGGKPITEQKVRDAGWVSDGD